MRPSDLLDLDAGSELWRIHSTGSGLHPVSGADLHPLAWDILRTFGPTKSRFDHQLTPNDGLRRIGYFGWNRPSRMRTAYATVLAEYFQDERLIDRHSPLIPTLTVHRTPGSLRLLDLESDWVVRAGGNGAIDSGERAPAREWSRGIYAHYPDVQGLVYRSSARPGATCIALFDRAEAFAFPASPESSRPLSDGALYPVISRAAGIIGYDLT